MIKIGNITFSGKVWAAPMAGITDKACRMINHQFGSGLVFTEMINDKGLVYQQARSLAMLDLKDETYPVAVQIFGKEPECIAQAAKIAEKQGAALIDINMGCPTPKIVKNGEGAALMNDKGRCRAIMRAAVNSVEIPVTVKMRRGWDDESTDCLEIGRIAEQEKIAAVTIHPRSRVQFFRGNADWDMVKLLKRQISIPVIGNGDIANAETAAQNLDYSGCDAIMVGRGFLGNPFIFREISAYLQTRTILPPPNWEERREAALKHLQLACKYKGENVGVREMRKHISWYCKGVPGAAKKRDLINKALTFEQMADCLSFL